MSNAIPFVPAQSYGVTPAMAAPTVQIKSLNTEQLLTLKLPKREYVLNPILPDKGIMMLHAARGTGKTFFVHSLAYAIASGGMFLGWKAERPRKVLVVDGEMSLADLKERIAGIATGCHTELSNPDNLKIIAADYHDNGLPDLSHPEGQKPLWSHFEAAEVIIFDTLSTLFTSLKESENDDSQKANSLFLELRRKGKAVVIVHHSGKGGGQRGASRREDPLNTIIALKRPDDCDGFDGAVFNVVFEKNRGFYGKDAETFKAEMITDASGGMVWRKTEIADASAMRVKELKAEGMTQREIATEMGIGLGTVNRILKTLKENGGG